MSIRDSGKNVANVDVRIGPQFLNLFSEHLYSSPNKAFEELVSNSWDAGARRVYINIPDDLADDNSAIWILDDGTSMDIEGFEALWSVATSRKRISEDENNRKQIGKFGVGKLATYLLAHELTYVCKANDGVVRAITMDYRRIDDQEKEALHINPLPLAVREIDQQDLSILLEDVPSSNRILQLIENDVPGPEIDAEFEDEFGGSDIAPPKNSGTWTLAVMSALKEPGKNLSVGWVRRLLRTALPLGRTITIMFNDEQLTSAKSRVEVVNEWVLGPGLSLGNIELDGEEPIVVEEKSQPYAHVLVSGLGEISGRFRLYADRISGGKSEEIEVSNGFFVNIRGRVIKPEDPYFGLANLSHSVWARFRATIRVDSLDGKLSVNREGVSDSREIRIFRALMMRLFNRVRADFDSRTAESWPDVGGVLTEKWGVVPFEPLKRVISERLNSAVDFPEFVHVSDGSDVKELQQEWIKATDASFGEMITDVVLSDLGKDKKLAHYDLKTRTIVVNRNHPFALEHQETAQQLRVLRDAALVELLTDAFMADIGLSTDQLSEIREYKDRAYRLVAQVRRRSASQIATLLVQATGHPKGFERIIGDALEYIGFSVERLGQSGEPEGIATAVVSPTQGDVRVAYKFNYDAKSSERGKVKTHNVGIAGLARHRADHQADHTLVVAPSFEEGALEQECIANKVTPMEAEDLARLVMMTVGFGPLNLVEFRGVFDLHSPEGVRKWVEALVERQKTTKHLSLGVLIQALIAVADNNPDRPDMIHCSQIADQCRQLLDDQQFPSRSEVAAAIRGLALMAPNVIGIQGQDVMLNAAPTKLTELISAQINRIPDGFRYGIARGVSDQ